MTKKEMFNEIINLATKADRQDIVDFATKEIALLNKRNSKESKVAKEKAAERIVLAEKIVDVVTTAAEPMRAKEIANAVGISPQRATPILRELVETEKRLTVTEGKKKVKLYTLLDDNEVEEEA